MILLLLVFFRVFIVFNLIFFSRIDWKSHKSAVSIACGKALRALSLSPLLVCSLHCVFPLAVSFHHKCFLNHLTGKLTWLVNSAEWSQSGLLVCLRL